ncbi:uncharacterized protein LOC118433579 isoform X2 [Folsomia candida]|uniref:uncharacterized protein LOC118433579 isoform X2 n=1 Tax=Folsomia candida TaxID=158441 RepID=UPI001604DE4B|nr:uncharacterized protein LOC118433579 isoform X2 [Folsomia candida]
MDCTTINSDIGDGPSAFQTPPENSIATVEKNFKVGGTSNGGNAIRSGTTQFKTGTYQESCGKIVVIITTKICTYRVTKVLQCPRRVSDLFPSCSLFMFEKIWKTEIGKITRAASPGVHEKPVPPKFCLG